MARKALAHLAVLIALATLLPSHVSPIPFARAQTPRYTVTMIPASYAKAVNDQGQVVGSDIRQISPGNFLDSAWLWDHGQVTVLDKMDRANGINNKGQIVGDVVLRSDDPKVGYRHAVLWDGGRVTDLGTLGGKRSFALAINDAGQVVGWSETASGETHAFLWENGKMIDLGTLPGYAKSIAFGINAKGQVVGHLEALPRHAPFQAAFLWQDGAMQDLGALPGATATQARRINDRGQIVGTSFKPFENNHCVLWENGAMRQFGPSDEQCTPEGINNNGQVVGWVPGPKIFLWENGKMQDLNTLIPAGSIPQRIGLVLSITNRGQILVHVGHASALLTPAETR